VTRCYYIHGVATNAKFIATILDKMFPMEVSAKPMFGEYGLYFEGKNFALVCDDTLFIKVTERGSEIAGRVTRASPYPGAKPAFKISSSKLNDHDWLVELVEETSRALPLPKPRKKRVT
jgi:TfoX/Sxy family transcriptional regulator of competence genes